MIASGSVEEIIASTGITRTLEIRATAGLERIESVLREDAKVQEVVFEPESDRVHIAYAGQLDDVADLLKLMLDHGVRVVQAVESASDLEEVFLRVTRGQVA